VVAGIETTLAWTPGMLEGEGNQSGPRNAPEDEQGCASVEGE